MWQLRCVVVAVWGSFDVGELLCGDVAVRESCGVGESACMFICGASELWCLQLKVHRNCKFLEDVECQAITV